MKVAMVQSGTEQGVGLLFDDKVISFTRAYPAYALASGSDEPIDPYFSILEMLQDDFFSAGVMEDVLRFLEDHQLLDSFTIENPTLLAPIARPPKIVALGRNYVAHIEELGHEIPSEPVLFAKAPTSVIGPNEAIIYFDGLDRVDHEIDLALVIGKTARRFPGMMPWRSSPVTRFLTM
jgi:hypothetical protein